MLFGLVRDTCEDICAEAGSIRNYYPLKNFEGELFPFQASILWEEARFFFILDVQNIVLEILSENIVQEISRSQMKSLACKSTRHTVLSIE